MRQFGFPMPPTSLWDGHLHLYQKNRAFFLVDEQLKEEYGRVFATFIGDQPSLIISDEGLLKQVFLANMSSFRERSKTFLRTPLSDGVLFAPHDRWKYMRSVLMPFFNADKVSSFSAVESIENSIKQLMDYLELRYREAVRNDKKLEINLNKLVKALALHTISSLAVQLPDVQVREDDPYTTGLDQFLDSADQGLVNYAIKFPFLNRFIEFMAMNFEYDKMLATMHRTLNSLIDSKISEPNQLNQPRQSILIDHLVGLHRKGKITRSELIALADSILFAGYDTTSNTMTSIFWVLGKMQDVQDRLRSELRSYGIESEYLMQVIKETMRCYPPVISFATRMATETVKIGDWTIPQGTMVVYNCWLMHKNPDLWPEPDKFDPERFSKGKIIHPCAFAPFGLGERRCLGYQLSLMEFKMILCDILLKYRVITISPDKMEQVTRAVSLAASKEPVLLELQKLNAG